jgi:hypothetical protein
MLLTSVAALGTIAGSIGSAEAAFTFTFLEQGGDVVATGSGTIDLAGFPSQTPVEQCLQDTGVWAQMGVAGLAGTVLAYVGITGPSSFGSGGFTVASKRSGDTIAVNGTKGVLGVPPAYVSGSALSSSMGFTGETFASIGLMPGTYIWTWGSGTNADSFTMQIGPAAVPEPPSVLAVGVWLLGLAVVRHRLGKS